MMEIEELKQKKLWVNWEKKKRANGKIDKVPISYSGGATGTNEEYKNTWGTFEQVDGKFDGSGIVLKEGLCSIDIDDNSLDNPIIQDIINTINTYTEGSPSGNGYHLLFVVDVDRIPIITDNEGKKKLDNKYYVKNPENHFECYISGLTNRYMTFTGNVVVDKSIEECTDKLLWFLDKYMVKPKTIQPIKDTSEINETTIELVTSTIKKTSKNEKFNELFNGNMVQYNDDHSSADMALCSILAFYCGDNQNLIDSIFRKSKLYRDKWDRQDYRDMTIQKAIENCNGNFYNGGINFEVLSYLVENNIETMYKWDDSGVSTLFAKIYNHKLIFNTTANEWYFYTGKVWSKDEKGMYASTLIEEFIKILNYYAINFVENEGFKDFTKKQMNFGKRKTLLDDSKSCMYMSENKFDVRENILNCQNGTLDLETMILQPHNNNDLLSKICNVSFIPNVKCGRWEQFIDEIMEENQNKTEYLQKLFGYSLTDDTFLERLFVLYGESTRNGKGTLVGSIEYMLGDYATSAKPSILAQKIYENSKQASPDVARLKGVRFLNISEPDRDLQLDSAFVKTVTGRDQIVARHLYKEEIRFIPQFKIFINCNYLPNISDTTLFGSDRIDVLKFTKHFDENERDVTLKDKFKEPQNMTGIFNWCLDGLQKFKIDGLKPPSEVKAATQEYEYKADRLKQFLDEKMQPSHKNITISETYEIYENWCIERDLPHETKKMFKEKLIKKNLYLERATICGNTYYNVIPKMELKPQ